MNCLFVSDLHGNGGKYDKLFEQISKCQPDAVFLGGDLFPPNYDSTYADFITDLGRNFKSLFQEMSAHYPRIFAILGNDDERASEPYILDLEKAGLIEYIHKKKTTLGNYGIYGYACVPPTPFLLKDWERYDVSRYLDPGSVAPEDGRYSYEIEGSEIRYSTIKDDLDRLTLGDDLGHALFLFHSPPYNTDLDLVGNKGAMIDHVPLDNHVGSIAIRRFIEKHQPLLTLHGHIHESARLSGSWKQSLGRTLMLTAAHDGPELALVHFSPESPDQAYRELI